MYQNVDKDTNETLYYLINGFSRKCVYWRQTYAEAIAQSADPIKHNFSCTIPALAKIVSSLEH